MVLLTEVPPEKCVICGALIPVTGPDNKATGNKQRRDPAVPESHQGTTGPHSSAGHYLHSRDHGSRRGRPCCYL
jgi:hypothetical protein